MKIWMNGKFIKSGQAKAPVFSYSLQRGMAVFASLSVYKTPRGPAIFRLKDHLKRFFNSAKFINMPLVISFDDLAEGIKKTVRQNRKKECCVRVLAFYPASETGILPKNKKVDLVIGAFPLPKISSPVSLKISSYRKLSFQSVPTQAKISANYLNSALARQEAQEKGFDDALFLDSRGYVAEAPIANFFMVKNNILVTPKLTTILAGITRDSVIKLARGLGYRVFVKDIKPQELFRAEEAFLTSSSGGVLPVSRINQYVFKKRRLTEQLRDLFFGAAAGQEKKYFKWLDWVDKNRI